MTPALQAEPALPRAALPRRFFLRRAQAGRDRRPVKFGRRQLQVGVQAGEGYSLTPTWLFWLFCLFVRSFAGGGGGGVGPHVNIRVKFTCHPDLDAHPRGVHFFGLWSCFELWS